MNFLTKLSELFIKRSRFTILLALSVVALGAYSYTSVLKREGFPVINIPVIVVTTPYFGGTSEKTQEDITTPIYNEISKIEGVTEITTSSTPFVSTAIVSIDTNIALAEDVKESIQLATDSANLPAKPNIFVPNAGFIDGQNDLVLSIYSNDYSIQELEQKAVILAKALSANTQIGSATAKLQYTTAFDPVSQQKITQRSEFSRVMINRDGELKQYDAINIGITKKDDSIGAIEFSDIVKDTISAELSTEAFENIKVIYGGDPANSLNKQISSLESNAIAAIITIFVILLLFINWRSAIILAIFIPLTLGATFLIFAIFGYTLNTISLFALILVLGLFVDDGIIVVEAIDYYKRKGLKGMEAIRQAINDIGVADLSGTLTTILVFAPLLTVTGILGDFIKILPLTVIIALAISLFIALTILPFLSNLLIKDKVEGKESIIEMILNFIPKIIINFAEQSGNFAKLFLSRWYYKLAIFIFTVFAFAIAGMYAGKLGFSFFAPAKDSDLLTVSIEFQQSNNIEEVISRNIEIENYLVKKFGQHIENAVYFAGDSREAYIYITLTPITERDITANEIAEVINHDPTRITGASFTASIISAGPPMSQYPFAMQIYSESSEELTKASVEVIKLINSTKLTDNKIVDSKVVYSDIVRQNDGKTYVEVQVQFEDNANSASLIELQEALESSKLNKSDTYTLGFDFGQESDNADSFSSISLAGVIALILMYAVLVLQFNSFTQPLLILLAVPFSFPGLFMGLYFTSNPMSFFVILGLTGLIGIVVNNTIMLVEYANARKRDGESTVDAIVQAITLRTRPILTTSLTTVAGLVPLALSEPFWEPLAFTIIFGLVSSVIMLVIAFPLFYTVVEDTRDWVFKKLELNQ